MLDKSHLPAAVECDLETIGDRDECEILQMAEECGRWLNALRDYRASLVTPAAQTVWAALVQGEFDQVSETLDRLTTEIRARSTPSNRSDL